MKHSTSVFAGILLGASLAIGAGKLLPSGDTAHLKVFGCHADAQSCTAEYTLEKDGVVTGYRQVRFGFDGKVKDQNGTELSGQVPVELTACVQAFKENKFETVIGDVAP